MWTAPGVVKKAPGTCTRQGVLLAQCGLLLLLMVMMSWCVDVCRGLNCQCESAS